MVVRKNDRDREQIPDGWRDVKQEQLRDTAFCLNETGRGDHNAHVGAEETKEGAIPKREKD